MAKYVGFRKGKVHESHVISEYYCGGCGFPVTDHDSFCPECGGAFRECDADDLESENAKLRELVLCLLTCASDSDDACDKCHVNGGAGIWELDDFCDSLLDRVRELRIEVGE